MTDPSKNASELERLADLSFHPDPDHDTARYIVNLLLYTERLEEMVIDLRKQIDEQTSNGSPKPYGEDLHHDLYEDYDGCRGYHVHRELIEYYLAFVKG